MRIRMISLIVNCTASGLASAIQLAHVPIRMEYADLQEMEDLPPADPNDLDAHWLDDVLLDPDLEPILTGREAAAIVRSLPRASAASFGGA